MSPSDASEMAASAARTVMKHSRRSRPFAPFALEEWQSRFEQDVAVNLADSGVDPITVERLLELADVGVADLMGVHLHYPAVQGELLLRERIADLHGADAEDVLVTVGAAEANHLLTHTLVRPGDDVVVASPGYRQVHGLATNLGARVSEIRHDSNRDWSLDLDALAAAVQRPAGTSPSLISVTDPSNPTGRRLTQPERDALVEASDFGGTWLHVDEVYRGSEWSDGITRPSMWGTGDRVVCTGSLSKSFGLSGLRVGWVIAPRVVREAMWRHHEYTTISAGALDMALATIALQPIVRQRLFQRTRNLSATGWAVTENWLNANPDLVSAVRPEATALAFVRYNAPQDSVAVATAIKDRTSVLVAPGAALGCEKHLRISTALAPQLYADALDAIASTIADLRNE